MNNTIKQVLELLDRKKRVLRHGRHAYYTYVDGKQFPSSIVKEATQIHYERRVQAKEDRAAWEKAMAERFNEKVEKDQRLVEELAGIGVIETPSNN